MGSFASAGVRLIDVSKDGVTIRRSTDHLHVEIEVTGAPAVVWVSSDGHSIDTWDEEEDGVISRRWPDPGRGEVAVSGTYALTFSFATASRYVLRLDRHGLGCEELEVLKRISYQSTNPNDTWSEMLVVEVVP